MFETCSTCHTPFHEIRESTDLYAIESLAKTLQRPSMLLGQNSTCRRPMNQTTVKQQQNFILSLRRLPFKEPNTKITAKCYTILLKPTVLSCFDQSLPELSVYFNCFFFCFPQLNKCERTYSSSVSHYWWHLTEV